MFPRLARYRDIVFYRIWAQLKSEARQNYLGYLWFALEPMLMTGIFFLVFGFLLESRSPEYLWFLTIGMITWQWFDAGLSEGMIGLKTKFHILSQMPLPKQIFPLVNIGAATWRFLCVMVVVLLCNIFWGAGFSFYWLLLPLLMLIQLGLIIGLSWILAVAVSYFDDTQKIVQALMRLLFYLSGIFFSVDRVPVDLKDVFYANPMAVLLQSYRNLLLHHNLPNFELLGYAALWSVGLMLGGFWLCKHVDKRLMKEVAS